MQVLLIAVVVMMLDGLHGYHVTPVEWVANEFKGNLLIDGTEHATARGLNIVVFSGLTGEYKEKKVFDTHAGDKSTAVKDYLGKITKGDVVFLFARDEMASKLGSLKEYIASEYNSKEITNLGYRDLLCLIAFQKGATVFERVSKKHEGQEFAYKLRLSFEVVEKDGAAVVYVKY